MQILINQYHPLFRWLPRCADKFLDLKMAWRSLVPEKNRDSLKLIQSFFYCARILMSMQLRSLVMRSLHHMLSLFVRFKVSFDGWYLSLVLDLSDSLSKFLIPGW